MMLITLVFLLTAFADIELTNDDNMKTINAKLGDKVNVKLTAANSVGGSQFQWSAPVSSNPRILTQYSSTTIQNGDATGTFTVNENGIVDLSSRRSCKPMKNQLCSFAILNWKVTINVQ